MDKQLGREWLARARSAIGEGVRVSGMRDEALREGPVPATRRSVAPEQRRVRPRTLTREEFWATLDPDTREFIRELGRRSGGAEFLGAWKC